MAATTKLPSVYKECSDNSCAFPAANLNKWKIVYPDNSVGIEVGLFFRRNGEIDFYDEN